MSAMNMLAMVQDALVPTLTLNPTMGLIVIVVDPSTGDFAPAMVRLNETVVRLAFEATLKMMNERNALEKGRLIP